MKFSEIELSETDSLFLKEVRAFLDEHLTEEVHQEEWETGSGHNVGFHKALGQRGWILPTWPVAQGGAGLTESQAAILQHELVVRNAPSITKGTTTLALPAIMSYGDPELAAQIARGVAIGDICICLGYTEPDAGSDLATVRTKATRDGDEWRIDGQKMFTTGAHNSHYSFLLARTDPDLPRHKGVTMFLVPLEGVEIRAVNTLGGERTNMVYFDGHRVHDRYRLGEVNRGWSVLLGPLNAEHGIRHDAMAVESRGGMYGHAGSIAFEYMEQWAQTPSALDGRRPIDDPHIRRRMARAALSVEQMSTAPGPMGRIVSSELLIEIAADFIDMLGPDGLLPPGTTGAPCDGWIEYAHRYAQGTAIYGGTTDVHRNIVAEHILGLPRSTPKV